MKLARDSWNRYTPIYQLHIDEAWRGPLAWPVAVGCVLVHRRINTTPFNDSKQLTHKQRDNAYNALSQHVQTWSISVWVWYTSNTKIDAWWMIKSLQYATLQAIGQTLLHAYLTHWRELLIKSSYGENIMAVAKLDTLFNCKRYSLRRIASILLVEQSIFTISSLLIDGNHHFKLEKLPCKVITIIKWDSKNSKIAMASIIAKVERDRWMLKIAKKLPQYWFENHKWYGTQSHRAIIISQWLTKYHRVTYCTHCIQQWAHSPTSHTFQGLIPTWWSTLCPMPTLIKQLDSCKQSLPTNWHTKPSLVLHICCGPDLTRPLHRLKDHFKLYLFWYNPNIHPRKEHTKRYAQFIKLVWLEAGDYEIIEDRYDPKEFFRAMVEQKTTISDTLKDSSKKVVLTQAWAMQERSSRCNPCYSMRLDQAAKQAAQHSIPYFTSTLLISPRKHGWKLFDWWIQAQQTHGSHFLWFDFAKNEWYTKAVHLTRKHKLRRQHYCGCWWTIPKPWEKRKTYSGG